MSEQDLRRLVDWRVDDETAGGRAGHALGSLFHLVSTVVTLGADAGMGARRPTWDVPADPESYLDLGPVELRWPAASTAEQVRATRRGVWTTPSGRPPSRVPVEALRIVEAVPARPGRQADSAWTLTLTDGSQTGTLSGAWLALAWIGSLAGWPEPAAP